MRYFLIVALFFQSYINAQTVTYDEVFPVEDFNFVLGTQGIGGKYQFSEESKLMEQSKHIRSMGSNVLKISLGKNALNSYDLKKGSYNTTLDMLKATDDYKKVMDMDFKYIQMWVHTHTGVKWKQGINKSEEKKLYNEMYELVSYLLKEYNNSGKTFMIGNWEGDWLLHPNYNRKINPPQEHVDNMTKWFQIRQRAVDDAKKSVEHDNVFVFHYIEVNLVLKGIDGQTCIAKDILPNVDVDLVSYSSYEAIKNRTYDEKKEQLEEIFTYLDNQLQPKEGLPFSRRVFIGEYGYHANYKNPKSYEKQFNETIDIMKIAFELDLPFALHWQMYNNEYTNDGVSKEMSLINEQGVKRELYYFHQNFYKQANEYLINYKEENNEYPNSKTFGKEAIKLINELEKLYYAD